MNTRFHELAHASHFRQAGQHYWIDYIANIVVNRNSPCGGYGCGDETDAGNVAIGEGWAEYMATVNSLRWHPGGEKFSWQFRRFLRYNDALERENWFSNDWITSGFFNDLNDGFNPAEFWDRLNGISIQQMYAGLIGANDSYCKYL